MKKTLSAISLLFISMASFSQNAYRSLSTHIMSPWGEKIDTLGVHREYPRPQMVRSLPYSEDTAAAYKTLNGMWSYAITDKSVQKPSSMDGRILVPFPLESALSGVGKHINADDALWYETSFTVPSAWDGRNVRINFDAVDWSAEVWVNGHRVGSHTGGYTRFSFDISPYIDRSKENALLVKVLDATDDNFQPRGKQVSSPGGIWYTPVSGIWSSVWLEPVGEAFVSSYQALADLDGNRLFVTVDVEGTLEHDRVKITLSAPKGTEDFSESVVAKGGEEIAIPVSSPYLWTPDTPYLYGLLIEVLRDGKVVDKVEGYCAMRTFSTMTDSGGHKRLSLNGEPIFMYGPLDQGWWPDGLYTAPSTEALIHDVKMTRQMGFNMIRKHIKVEPDRWYHACDSLGVIVWQDMPCFTDSRFGKWDTEGYGGVDTPAPPGTKANYYKEWGEIIDALKVFPCIAVWVPFNEAWGQFDTKDVVDFTTKKDPSRLVNYASGGNFVKGCGDILDNHHYPNPHISVWDDAMVVVLGEYGGIGYPVEGHLWKQDSNWGYVKYSTPAEVLAEYEKFADELKGLVAAGVSAAVYTQTTDVEVEVNGLMTYDRKVVKINPSQLSRINKAVIESMKE